MRSIGLRVQDISIIHALLPLNELIGPPFLGFLADKFGHHKLILTFSLIFSGLSVCSLLFVPKTASSSFSIDCALEEHANNTNDNVCYDNCQLRTPFNATFCGLRCTNEDNSIANVSLADVLLYEVSNGSDCTSLLSDIQCHANCSLTCKEGRHCDPSNFSILLYFALRFAFQLFSSITYLLIETTAVILAKKHNSEFGRQRFWGILAQGLIPLVIGVTLEQLSGETAVDYSPVMYMFAGTVLINVIVLYARNIDVTHSNVVLCKNLRTLVTGFETIVFFVVLLVMGSLWGVTKTYVLWFASDLSGPTYLIGLSVTVSTLLALPLSYMSKRIMKRTGHIPIFVFALFAYTVRFVGLSFVYNPWLFIVLESLDCVTYNLAWICAVTYGALLAPKELITTMLGIIAALHYGIGIGSGSLLGGLIIKYFGIRTAFQIIGGVSAATGVLYALFYVLCVRLGKQKT